MTLKCKSCIHYYRTMVTREGYNPSPYCHLYEDAGQRPNVLTQECFEKLRPDRRTKQRKKKT